MARATVGYNEGAEISEEGRWEDAVMAYTELIESDPSDTDPLARTYRNQGFALDELGRFEEAMADNTVVIELVRRGENSSEVEPFGDEWGSNLG